MNNTIRIEMDQRLKGRWLRINMPYNDDRTTTASLQHTDGTVLKEVQLFEGSNAIDVSSISETVINLKIETAYETVLKEVKLI